MYRNATCILTLAFDLLQPRFVTFVLLIQFQPRRSCTQQTVALVL